MIDEKFLKLVQRDSENEEALSLLFIRACINGDLEKIKYLLTSSYLKKHAQISHNNYQGFFEACERGSLDIVKYLLTSPELKEHADIHAKEDYIINLAVNYEYTDIINYLLFSSDLQEHADINGDNCEAIYSACYNGSFDLVKWFLNDNRLKEKTHLPNSLAKAVKGCLEMEQTKILEYLIFDINIEKSNEIELVLKNHKRNFSKVAESMFQSRDLNQELKFIQTNEAIKKVKI
jgi:ankyrin repeat protein